MISKWAVRLSVAALAGVLILVPIAASAQQASGIAGVVRGASGAVLPGVTVEAASPVLIEKVRTVVTNGQGRYNIVDLRSGTYTVAFSLAGFSTVRREGIALSAGFTATVNADLQEGALDKTITAAISVVDTQNVRQQQVISDTLVSELPSGTKGLMDTTRNTPGLSNSTNPGGGGAAGINGANRTTNATLHGKGGAKNNYDGMGTMNLAGTGSVSYIMNPATVETSVSTGGVSAESDSSGLSVNMIPKEGGNIFHFGADGTYTNEHLQGDNLSDTLRARGLTTTGQSLWAYDANVTVAGPLMRDRLWFFAATRFSGTKNQNPNKFFNKTQGTPFFTADLDRPAYYQDGLKAQAGRITWQVSSRNKVNGFADTQDFETRGQGDNAAPEAHTCWSFWPAGLYQSSWTSPVTSKFLLEAGASLTRGPFPCTREDVTDLFGFTVKPTDVSTLESSTGFRYNAKSSYSLRNDHDRFVQRFSASYVTGSHNFKVGLQLQEHAQTQDTSVNGDVTYTYTRGVPTRVTQFATPYLQMNRTKADLGVFAQDQWAIKRLTLSYGLRLDYFNGYVPAEHVDAGQFAGARDFAPVHSVPEWTDLNPRMGASYDLFGTGRTALKASLGRYVEKAAVAVATANNPITTSINSVNRTWTDTDQDYVPDCDLHNFSANGECAAIDNVNFGKSDPSAVQYADDLIRGFGVRPYFWDLAAEVQHEFGPRVSMTAGYYRNWSDHFGTPAGDSWTAVLATDNQAWAAKDFSHYCITAPVNPQLPGGGGYQVCGLYDVAPALFGQGTLLVARPSNYGQGKSRISNFVSASVSTRLGRGIELSGSLDTGSTVSDLCFVVDSPQDLLNCRVISPFKAETKLKLHGVYPLPGGFIVSGSLQNVSGVQYLATYAASNAEIAPSLGRNLAACGKRAVCTSTATVPLIAPQTQFEPRRTAVDLRLSKVFRVGPKTRLRANLDLYNLLNDSSTLAINNNYGSSWLQPDGKAGGLVPARSLQFGGQLTY